MRILLKLVSFIVILIVVAAVALPFIIDPNEYKPQIAEQVKKTTGRTLTIDGDIGLSVFPWVSLELGSVSLSNAEGFQAKQFAQVNAAEVRIKLIPLLSKQLEMDTVVLDGLTLNLEKAKNGVTNWDDLTQSTDKKSSDAQKQTEKSPDADYAPALAAISIAGVHLTNANVVWTDHSKDEQIKIENLSLQTDPLVPGKPTALELDFNIITGKPETKAHITLATDVNVDLEKQRYALNQVDFKTKAEGANLPLPVIELGLQGDITADMAEQTVDLTDLVIQIHDLLINSHFKVTKLSSESPAINGAMTLNAFNLRQLAKQLAIELPPMADDSTLELVEVKTDISASANHVMANNLAVTLDQSTLSGHVGVTDFAKPAIDFKLTLDEIDADRYLPPVQESTSGSEDNKTKPVASPATASAAGAEQLPLDTLRSLNVKGTMDINKLKISNTHSENVHVEINAKNGQIKFNPMNADLYQGQYQGNVSLNAQGKKLVVSIDENLQGVQVEPLLNDLTGEAKISGTVNTSVKLTGSGSNPDQIKQTLSGNGQFAFTDGALKGINIAGSIRKAKAALKGDVAPQLNEPVQTDFSSLQGSFTASNGVFSNQDFALMSPLLRVNGAGTADIVKEAIDYGLKVSIVETSKGQGGKELAELKGLTIPVKITGSFSEPKPTVDLASLAKEKATEEIKAKVSEKLSDKLGDKLGNDLGGLLGGALGGKQASEPADEAEPESNETQEKAPAKAEDQLKDAIGEGLKSLF